MKTKISNLWIFCGFYFSDVKTLDKTPHRTKLNCFIIDTTSSEGLRHKPTLTQNSTHWDKVEFFIYLWFSFQEESWS